MKQVILYGHLAKKFGRHHKLDVRTPAEAVRALQANFPEFREHVIEHPGAGYHVRVGRDYRDTQGLHWPADDVIRIVPAVAGASGLGKIIVGALLIVASFYFPPAAAFLKAVGTSLVLGGVAQILFPPPKSQTTEPVESKPSYAFDGPTNTVAQGNPVPICYGRLIVGSQVISAGLTTTDIPV